MRAFGPEFMTQVRWGESGVKGASGHGRNSLTKVIKGETFTSIPQPVVTPTVPGSDRPLNKQVLT